MNDDTPSAPPDPSSPTVRLVRAGCLTLVALGALSGLLSAPSVFAPGSVRCSIAEQLVEDADTDDKGWNDTGAGGDGDVPCAESVTIAEGIPVREGGDETRSVPGESAIQIRGSAGVVIGIGQAGAGVLTLRTRQRRARTAAVSFAALGIVFAVLGIISIAALAFVVYAINFSAASRQVWPRPGRPAAGDGPEA